MENFSELIKNRRSMRKFTDEELTQDQVVALMKAALMSPSSKRSNSWQFVVVDDKEVLKELSHCKEQASSFIADAALAIVVMADPLASDVLRQQDGLRAAKDDEADIYVGIPFCLSRCSYCSFTCGEIKRLEKYVEPYLDALEREILAVKRLVSQKNIKVKNIYFGGGTPTSVSAERLDGLLSLFGEYSPREFCVEAGRPDTIDTEKLEIMASRGVNRISVNPQSFNQRILDEVGRNHTVEEIYLKHSMAKNFSFDVNMDLIAGLPGESEKEFRHSVDCAAELRPENITVHTLALKKGSVLKERET